MLTDFVSTINVFAVVGSWMICNQLQCLLLLGFVRLSCTCHQSAQAAQRTGLLTVSVLWPAVTSTNASKETS